MSVSRSHDSDDDSMMAGLRPRSPGTEANITERIEMFEVLLQGARHDYDEGCNTVHTLRHIVRETLGRGRLNWVEHPSR